MSNLFNLDNMFSESSIFEALRNPIISESYRSTVLVPLKVFNEAFNANTEKLYMSISEAETKEQENDIFTHYFIEIEKAFSDLIKQISEIESRFVIRIDNMVDANLDILKNTSALADCKAFHYRMYEFKNIADADFPKINPLSIYNKEFDFMGQLLQDLGPAATNQMKLQVIASVYNALNKGNSDQLTKKCVKDILDMDDDDDCDIAKFPKKLYEKFRKEEAEDKMIDKGMLYSIQLSLKNYKTTVAASTATSEKLISQFEEIKRSILSFISGTPKNTLEINTPTDGVKNTTYKVDTYTMNQLDLFMKTKINQIVQMANIYVIALSVKLDAVVEYYKQCKDILNHAEMTVSGLSGTADDNQVDTDTNMGDEYPVEDNGPTGEENPEPELNGEDDISTDDSENTDTDPENNGSENPEDSGEQPESSDDGESMEDLSDDLDEAMKDFEEACILAEYQIFAIEQENARNEMYNRVLSYYHEDGEGETKSQPATSGETKTTTSATVSSSPTKKAVDKSGRESIINTLMRKLGEFWRNFQETIFIQSSNRLKVLAANEKYITTEPFDMSGEKIMPRIKTDSIDDIKIPDFNYTAMKDKLSGEDEFFKKTWATIARKDDQKISDAVINHVIDYDNPYTNTKELNPSSLYNWCKLYPGMKDQLNKDISILTKGQNNAKNIAKQAAKESTLDDTVKSYFMEFDSPEEPKKDDASGEKTENTAPDKVEVYFKVCIQVCRAKLTVVQRTFNEYTAYLLWHINKRRKNEGSPTIGWMTPKDKK